MAAILFDRNIWKEALNVRGGFGSGPLNHARWDHIQASVGHIASPQVGDSVVVACSSDGWQSDLMHKGFSTESGDRIIQASPTHHAIRNSFGTGDIVPVGQYNDQGDIIFTGSWLQCRYILGVIE